MKKNILIIGNGAFGIAISQVLLDNNHNVFVFSKNEEAAKKLKNGYHSLFEGIDLKIPNDCYSDYSSAFSNHIDVIILCVPSIAINDIFVQIQQYLQPHMVIVNTVKGLSPNDSPMWSHLFLEPKLVKDYCLLVGPSFASEIVNKNKTIVNIVADNVDVANEMKAIFNNDYFKLVYFGDEYVASLVSSFKNSLALALGLLNAFTKSVNTKAAYLIIGINEIQSLVSALTHSKQIKILDFFGVGDIYLTCTSDKSRNFQFGKLIGELGFEQADLQIKHQTVEGYRTLAIIKYYMDTYHLDLVMFKTLYEICYNNKDHKTFIDEVWKKLSD